MGHYYAYCEKHGKCGDDHDDSIEESRELAWGDVTKHKKEISGSHGEVYVKHSVSVMSRNGNKYYKYSAFKK